MSRRSQRALKKRVKTQRRNIKKVRNDNSGKKTSSKSLKNSMRKVTFSQFQTLMDDEYDRNFTGQNVNSSEIKDHRPDIDNDELSALIDTNTFKYAYITPKKIRVNGREFDLRSANMSNSSRMFQELKAELAKNKLDRTHDGKSKNSYINNDPESELSIEQQSVNQSIVDVLSKIGVTFDETPEPLETKNYKGREVSINCPPGLADPKQSLGESTRFSYENLDNKIDSEKDGSTGNKNIIDLRKEVDLSGVAMPLMDAIARAKFTRDEQYSATLPRSKDSADKLRKNRDPNYFDITNPNNFLETRVRRKSGKINPEILRSLPNQLKAIMFRKSSASKVPPGISTNNLVVDEVTGKKNAIVTLEGDDG
tara:strand:- start:934 stop:2034 length:1101 start_codon:yes stop_codon:yes gene_type:complete